MSLNFVSKVRRANKAGTGFIQFPKRLKDSLEIDSCVKVSIKHGSQDIDFFGVVKVYDYEGVYVPKEFAKKYGLIGKEVNSKVTSINGFHAKISSDGRIYFPIKTAEGLNLIENSVVRAALQISGTIISEYCRVDTRMKNKSKEYYAFFGPKYYGKEAIVTLEKLPEPTLADNGSKIVNTALKNFNFSFLPNKEAVIIEKHKQPLIISTDISFNDLSHYLGAYFSDGTKKGNSWAICASTFEQAEYYLSMHKKIIKTPNLKFNLSFTTYVKVDEKLNDWLKRQWAKKAHIEPFRIRFRPSLSLKGKKHNKYGTLVIKENRILVLNIYNKLLNALIRRIISNNQQTLALNFILGVLEGDGASNAKKRGHLQIATNKADASLLEKILDAAKLKYKSVNEKGSKYFIRINSLELIKNLPRVYNSIFKYYPKRRKTFFKRLVNTPTAQFILRERETIPSWIKAKLKKDNILAYDYSFTKFGNKVGMRLRQMEMESRD